MYNLSQKKIWVAGHNGMVGKAVVRKLSSYDCEIICANKKDLNLLDQKAVQSWMKRNKPDAVIICAAKVGGILANSSYPADFLYNNLMIETNIIHAAHLNEVEKLLFLGSSCIYPREANQPIIENSLLTGALEPTNEWYAIAKIAGIKLCQAYRKQHKRDFISAMPTNLFGPFDNFDLKNSHVIPALIRKCYESKRGHLQQIEVWGTGRPRREFLHVDDCASCLIHLLQNYSGFNHVNVGSGEDLPISELVELIKDVVGFNGKTIFDASKPDGPIQKLLDVSVIRNFGWQPQYSLKEGLEQTYEWFINNKDMR